MSTFSKGSPLPLTFAHTDDEIALIFTLSEVSAGIYCLFDIDRSKELLGMEISDNLMFGSKYLTTKKNTIIKKSNFVNAFFFYVETKVKLFFMAGLL